MKFRKIFQLEFTYQVRRATTWLYFAVMLVFAYMWVIGNYIHDARDGYFLLNAPIVIAAVTVLCSLFWLPVGASVAGDAAARDVQTRMHSLTYTAPAGKANYLGGRFLAAFALNTCIMLGVPVGILLGMHFSGVEAEILGPFRTAAYLTVFFYILIPNAFYATAIQFSLAALSRRAMVSYLGGALLFAAAFLFGQFLQNAGEWGNLIDPVNFTPVMSLLSNEWTPLEKSTRLFQPEGSLLWNRFLWFGISLGMLALTYFRFQFHTPETGKKRKKTDQPKTEVSALSWLRRESNEVLPQVRGTYNMPTHLRQLRVITSKLFLQLAKSPAGLLLLAAIALLVSLSMPGNIKAKGVPLWPRTDYVVNYITAPLGDLHTFWILITLLTIFYAGELVWKERETGINEIANAAPVPEWVLFLSRLLALSLMLIVWLALLLMAGIFAQDGIGGAPIELGLYVKALFGLQLVECLLWVLLALFVHVLVNHKYLGHFFALLAFGFIAFAPGLGISHKLLIFGSSPGWSYTSMTGFNLSLEPWLWFKFYWLSWSLLLAVAAKLCWVRGREVGLKSRFRLGRRRITRSTIIVATVAVAGILLFGGFIFYNTNVHNNYLTSSEMAELRARYEQRYKKYARIPQPQQASTSLHIEIYPEKREAIVRGTYLLVNHHQDSIDSVHVSIAPGVETKAITFNQPTTRVLEDNVLGYQVYTLAKPLQPGDSLQLGFEVQVGQRGFSNNGADASITPNSTNFRNYEWLPAIGYQSYRELDNAEARAKYGLVPRPATASLYDVAARLNAPFAERITFDAVVGTDKGQIVVAPGTLRQTWTKGARRYFHYATDAPIRNEYSFFSANYAVYEGRWKDVAIQIYHDPEQSHNLARIVRSVQASLAYYSRQFGPYPHHTIRFVSDPGYEFGNHAAPINITTKEGFFLMNPDADPRKFDLVSAVVAHEVAHQWWGNQLDPALVEGAGLLSESLAWYSAMGVLEDKYGAEQLQRLLSFLREEYDNPHTQAAVPLLQANDWYQNYRKGPFALYALSQYIGREKVNKAIRHLLEKNKSGKPPLPTSLDLYRELQAATPDSLQYLLHDLFKENTFWELKTRQTRAKQIKPDIWQVTLEVQARKFKVDSIGVETMLPLNDWIEVGVFGTAKAGKEQGEMLSLKKYLFHSAKQKITLLVPGRPSQAGIDPRYLLIDWDIKDNIADVKMLR
ncbi:ABC transporter permease/M1 family aminopeptidase [Pontibacter liquoris]|uniref:ABC transporter permease/M1 family aminopeptidase n=1 Tax=Pontibacter liquoris TaxID=2905677 RepID=UPI001FA7A77C|nr:M1 family aminopeptidase [Pontibacter liquoris]